MTHDTRTVDEIERDISHERSQMSSTIDELQKKFSVDAITDDLGHMIRDIGNDFGDTMRRTVGRNPAAMVMVGAGLAWLVLGANRNTPESRATPRYGSSRRNIGQAMSDDEGAWFGSARRNRQGYGSGQSGAMGNGAGGMMDRAKHVADDTASSISDTASDVSDWLSHGLEDLSDAAKTRVMAARRAAHDARDASEAAMHRGAGAARDLFRDQPLVVGALAVAFGAAVGSMLPHSRLEDDTMGAHSDQLFRDAQAVYHEERNRAMAALKGVAGDVKDEFDDAASDLKAEARDAMPDARNVGEVVADRASDAAKRVYGNAKETYDNNGSDRSNV